MDILNLPGWTDSNVQEDEYGYTIIIMRDERAQTCPICSTPIQQFGTRSHLFFDLPIHGKHVQLLARLRRYRCKNIQHRHAFHDTLPGMDEHYAATTRLVHYIEREGLAIDRSFAALGRDLGVSEGFIRKVVTAHLPVLEHHAIETPSVLGMDEINLESYCAVFTDLAKRRLIDIIEGRELETVKRWLRQLQCPETIQTVCMDMWVPFKLVVREILPWASIVIDKFHVLQQANAFMDAGRKAIRGKLTPEQLKQLKQDHRIFQKREKDLTPQQQFILESWTGFVSELGDLYRLKEEFYAIYDATSERDAYDRYLTWQSHISPSAYETLLPLQLMLDNWGQEIFAYFSTSQAVTNAFTESSNRIIRDAHRLGRSYSFRVLRAKLLFGKQRGLSLNPGTPKRRRKRIQPQLEDIQQEA